MVCLFQRGALLMKVSLFLPDEMYNRVRVECEKQDLKTSQFIQLALEHEFNAIDGEKAIADLYKTKPEDLYKLLADLSTFNDNFKILSELRQNGDDVK